MSNSRYKVFRTYIQEPGGERLDGEFVAFAHLRRFRIHGDGMDLRRSRRHVSFVCVSVVPVSCCVKGRRYVVSVSANRMFATSTARKFSLSRTDV